MNLKSTLTRLIRVVIEEAERNQEFEKALLDTLGENSKQKSSKTTIKKINESNDVKRGKNRRAAAVLDPILLVRDGELTLRRELMQLSLDQLRDIVAEFGMDPGRLVMKWTSSERVIDRIVEMAITRAQKGNAFRKNTDETLIIESNANEKLSQDVESDRSQLEP